MVISNTIIFILSFLFHCFCALNNTKQRYTGSHKQVYTTSIFHKRKYLHDQLIINNENIILLQHNTTDGEYYKYKSVHIHMKVCMSKIKVCTERIMFMQL